MATCTMIVSVLFRPLHLRDGCGVGARTRLAGDDRETVFGSDAVMCREAMYMIINKPVCTKKTYSIHTAMLISGRPVAVHYTNIAMVITCVV